MGKEVIEWCLDHWAFCAFVIGSLIQFTPVKLKPFTALVRWIGKVLTGDVAEKVSSIESLIDENEKDRIRWEVLDFANSCRNGIKHTKDEYQHIITQHGKYKRLLEKTGDENGVFDAEYEYILRLYAERQEKNDFLS